ncbi:TetR/AcrR family transcriptional regulator [Sinomonas mesophila]|uniref:TetR/AcrR family transcriptional regulator n=1 Tax=Sinomonas mesophila TaxID=1531955 RepID=UPI00098748EC|nr:TetR family transcriptional regulator C-terminal domain-containing protein [Sinomonas mesophila]
MPRFVDAAARRRDVVEAVKRIVVADGLERVSLREVAAEAGLVVGSVRHYFATSTDLLVQSFEAVVDTVLERLEDASPGADDGAGSPPGASRGGLEDAVVAQLCQLLPLDKPRAVDLCVWTAFKLAARTRPELSTTAERSHRAVAAAVGRSVLALRPGAGREELVREAERLLAVVEGLGLHAMLQGQWLDAGLCLAVLRAQVASVGAAVPT